MEAMASATSSAMATVGAGGGAAGSNSTATYTDPTSLLHTQLASALSTLGDAQYWEETISPQTIRNELSQTDPANPHSTPTLLRGMKWLLASISKGRDVSDFFAIVVKLVAATSSLEVRKMVYMYVVQYADCNATTRELSLLSINSFQRGLADPEQWIRAMALRVLTSIRLVDIVQIQLLAIQTCAKDTSPYVRKCAANAIIKLVSSTTTTKTSSMQQQRTTFLVDDSQREALWDILRHLLHTDHCTMVLSSCLMAVQEWLALIVANTPNTLNDDEVGKRLEILHSPYRKICGLLTDMDEWGQVVVLDLLQHYCRRFFQEPKGFKQGSAELVDQERRVVHHDRRRRRRRKDESATTQTRRKNINSQNILHTTLPKINVASSSNPGGFSDFPEGAPAGEATTSTASTNTMTTAMTPQKVKRRVLQEGFYSDEEDESVEEEVYLDEFGNAHQSAAAAMRQRNILGLPSSTLLTAALPGSTATTTSPMVNHGDDEDTDLDPDHRLLLASARPLLKSRNAGVVLGVCSLMYHCGVASIKARSAMGKALVRIHRGRREIQYVVLTSIRTLAQDCPSAFCPFLPEFYVKAMDPPHTRAIKLDILVSLALEPAAIEAVLEELRTYIRTGDSTFVCAAIRAVGRVAELARIVHDRHGETSSTGDALEERRTANKIAMDCLYGLAFVTQSSDRKAVIGEAVCIMSNILTMLWSTDSFAGGDDKLSAQVDDPNHIQAFALRRILLLLIQSLSTLVKASVDQNRTTENDSDAEEEKDPPSPLDAVAMGLPCKAVTACISMVGDWLSNANLDGQAALMNTTPDRNVEKAKVKTEVLRLLDRAFPLLEPLEKEQAVHIASKILLVAAAVSPSASSVDSGLCEHILSMGRIDVNPDVKDRARFETGVVHESFTLKKDTEAIEASQTTLQNITIQHARSVIHQRKPPPSFLPVKEDSASSSFRFGSLSSLMGHRARGSYVDLPPWSKKNSPASLREAADPTQQQATDVTQSAQGGAGFYGPDDSSSSSSSESNDADSESESEDSSDDSSSSSSSADMVTPLPSVTSKSVGKPDINLLGMTMAQPLNTAHTTQTTPFDQGQSSSSSDSSDDSSSSSSSSDDGYSGGMSSANLMSPPGRQGDLLGIGSPEKFSLVASKSNGNGSSSAIDDLKGLVMSPISMDTSNQPDEDRDSSEWTTLVRSELCAGLSVQTRYLRGPTRSREAQLKGLDPASPSIVCVQFQFENRKTDGGTLRKVRILPRSGAGKGVKIKKSFCPSEISELKPGQNSTSIVLVEFSSVSNHAGDLVARLDVKSSTSGVPVELKPNLAECLRPYTSMTTEQQFDSAMAKLQGFGRVECKVKLGTTALSEWRRRFRKHANVLPVGDSQDDTVLRFVGQLPASDDLALFSIVSTTGNDCGKLIVCCDNAVAVNSLLSAVKPAFG